MAKPNNRTQELFKARLAALSQILVAILKHFLYNFYLTLFIL